MQSNLARHSHPQQLPEGRVLVTPDMAEKFLRDNDKDMLASIALGLPPRSMTMDEYSNAIPPVYAKHVAEAALSYSRA